MVETTIVAPARERRSRSGLKDALPTVASLDKRRRSTQIVLQLRNELLDDLGGPAAVSAGQRQLVDRAAVLGAAIESTEVAFLRGDALDLTQYSELVALQARILRSLGIQRARAPQAAKRS